MPFKSSLISKLILSILALILISIMMKLGFWQLNRAEFKHQKQQVINSRLSEDAKAMPKQEVNAEDWQYFYISVKGEYLDEMSILIDNVVHQSVAGVSVVTPFKPEDSESLLLIDRGWIAWGEDRTNLPSFDTPQGSTQVAGLLVPVPSDNFYLQDPEESTEREQLWSQLDFNRFKTVTQKPLQPLLLRLDENQPGSYKHISQIDDDIWVTRHKAYALQWFALSLTLMIITVVLIYKYWIKKETT